MIIDPTDFVDRPYKVPNQEESRDFIAFLEAKEDELGRMILGHELWEEFADALADSGTLDPIYEALRDGAHYDYNNKTHRYAGWVDMVRPGIFSEWLANMPYKLTNVGYIQNDAPDKSSLLDDQFSFQVAHWNEFVRKVGGSRLYRYNCVDSLYGFLKANEDDYPSLNFTCPAYKNRYDL